MCFGSWRWTEIIIVFYQFLNVGFFGFKFKILAKWFLSSDSCWENKLKFHLILHRCTDFSDTFKIFFLVLSRLTQQCGWSYLKRNFFLSTLTCGLCLLHNIIRNEIENLFALALIIDHLLTCRQVIISTDQKGYKWECNLFRYIYFKYSGYCVFGGLLLNKSLYIYLLYCIIYQHWFLMPLLVATCTTAFFTMMWFVCRFWYCVNYLLFHLIN